MNNKCENTYHSQCKLPKYKNYNECVLHCSKENLSSLHNPYFEDYKLFYDSLIEYILEELLFIKNDNDLINKENLEKYFSLTDDKFQDLQKLEDLSDIENGIKHTFSTDVKVFRELLDYFKKNKITFSKISFPNTDSRDAPNYEYILKKLGKIHFNYCSFYITSLNLHDTECFFQDCEFYEYWSLKNFKVSQELDDLEIYNACIFHQNVIASGSNKDKYILDNVQFNGCTFKKSLNIEDIIASKAIFNDWIGFESQIEYLKIQNSSFDSRFVLNSYKIEQVNIENTIFKDKFEFKDNIVNKFDVNNSNFKKLAEFYNSVFETFLIFKSIFSDYTGFEKCKFGSEQNILNRDYIAKFKYVTFLSFINFRNTHFYSGLSFEDTNLKESPNFLNTSISFENTTRETFRIIKYSFDRIGNHIEANKFFSLEMKKYKEELFKEKKWTQEKIVFFLNEKISDFGQNYIRPIILLMISASLFACLLYSYKHRWLYRISPEHNTYIQSVSNFFNGWAHGYLPFSKFFVQGMELLSLLFYIINLILLWQIVVAVKRHTKR